ncbi:MAG: hypothetical protein ACR2O1_01595 [Boseongicola sp.]
MTEKTTLALFALFVVRAPAAADDATITDVVARNDGNSWTFSVTLEHGDTGWDDYADGWRVVADNGAELGLRTLFHPHVNEQPFTRSQSGIAIPDGVTQVYVEARTNADGWGETRFAVELPN